MVSAEDASSLADDEDKPKGKILKVVCGLMCIGVIISVVLVVLFMTNSTDEKPKPNISLDYLQNNWLVSDQLPSANPPAAAPMPARPTPSGNGDEGGKGNTTNYSAAPTTGDPDKIATDYVKKAYSWNTLPQITQKEFNLMVSNY